MKRLILGAALIAALLIAAPASAAFRSEDAAEAWFETTQADAYADFDYKLDRVWCDGYGRMKDDGDDELFRKFRCESEFSGDFVDEYIPEDWASYEEWEDEHEEWEEGVEVVSRLKPRASGGFRMKSIDRDWW